ncbi:MAG: polysaccharide deacetylase family protein [Clostridia bacterium]|nr:polysaccharide deacetylase family protein [Clostridia bacterium]
MKFKETVAVNLIIILMLCVLWGYSLKQNVSVSAFAGNGPVYKAAGEEKTISLMINVYQGDEIIKEYLELFEKENIKATFFLGGCWAAKSKDCVREIYNAGHEIGNHGYNHKLHTKLTREQSKNEILRTNSLLKEITGKTPTLFAPPSGDVNESVVNDATECGCITIMWSADTIDWRDQDAKKIYSRVERNLQPGVFVLMHPTKATLEALPDVILLARAQGYTFTTVSQALKI